MTVGDWNRITASLSPDIPVIFYNAAEKPLPADTYCEGAALCLSQLWDARLGWCPCVTVDLGEEC